MNVLILQTQRTVDDKFCKLEVLYIFHLAFHFQFRINFGRILPVGKIVISLHNQFAAYCGNFHALVAKRLAQFFKTLACVDKLNLSCTFFRFVLAHYPYIGSDTGIIKQIVRQLDNGLQPVVFEQIASYFAFTASCITFKQRRTVLDNGHTSVFLQFGHPIEHEQHLSVALCRQSRSKTSCFAQLIFSFHTFFGCFPVDTERRIRNDIVELIPLELVIAKRITQTHIVGITAFDKHIGLGNTVYLRIKFLTVACNFCFRIYLTEPFVKAGQHLAGSHCHIVYGCHYTLILHFLLIVAHEQLAHQVDDVACGKVRSSLVVIRFGELSDQFFKDIPHIYSRNDIGSQISFSRTELLDDEIKTVIVVHLLDFIVEVHAVDDINHILREMIEVILKVVFDVIRIGKQYIESKLTGVVELLPGCSFKETFLYGYAFGIKFFIHLDYSVLCRCKSIFETLDYAHWKNHLSVFVRFV